MIDKASSWFGHCYYMVCDHVEIYGAEAEVEKDHVRVYLCLNFKHRDHETYLRM